MIPRIAFLLMICAFSAVAQQQPTDAHGVTLQLGDIGRTQRFALFVPAQGELRIIATPQSMTSLCSVERSGAYGGKSMAVMTIGPDTSHLLRSGAMMTVRVEWTEPLIRGPRMVPPSSFPVLNPEWHQRTGSPLTKSTDKVQGGIQPSVWYDPSQPHVRIETANDGVAVILADEVLPIAPSLAATPAAQLALYWRGRQQHCKLLDGDASGTLTAGDSILFLGRHAQGDTTWLDLQDTVAVFFLTRRAQGASVQMDEIPSGAGPRTPVRSLFVQERFELDTGYYHPGSNGNEDYSTFMTPMSMFEGFYWEALNGRAHQYATHTIPFSPSGDGMITVVTDVVASTDAKDYDPDHGIDVSVNGAPATGVVGNGFVRYMLESTIDATSMPPGRQSIRLFASGIPGLENTPDWYSEVLLDAFSVKGLAAPVLDGGRLRGRLKKTDASTLVVYNAPPGAAYVIDTTNWRYKELTQDPRGMMVRAGITPVELPWPDSLAPAGRYRTTVVFDDMAQTETDQRGYVVMSRSVTSNSIRTVVTQNAAECAATISAISTDEVCVVFGAGASASTSIRDALQIHNVTLSESDTLWIAAFHGASGNTSQNTASPVRGLTWFVPSSRARGGSVTAELPADMDAVLVIGSGGGIEVARVKPASLVNLSASSTRADVITIIHPSMKEQAERWAEHRAKQSGLKIRIVNVNDIFDEYDAGRHSPEALREFLADAFDKAPLPKPTHCVLIGSATWDVRVMIKGGNARSTRPDLVPTYGRPSSDYWFGLLDDPTDIKTPELIVSRFPVLTPEECSAMIEKIMVDDTIAYAPWQRTFLYVGGGETEDEGLCQIYEDMLSDKFYTGILYTEPTLCIDTITICKPTEDNPGLEIRKNLSDGVGLMNYIGHGGTEIFDIKGWDPEDLTNVGRYPVMATFSCLTGAFSNSSALCRNGQYLVQPNAGFVAAIGASGWQYKYVVSQIHTDLHEALRTTSIRDLGRLTYAATRGQAISTPQHSINATLQFNILGDPFTRIHIDTNEQVSLAPSRVVVTSPVGGSQIREDDDSANVDVTIWSEGTGSKLPYLVRMWHTFDGVTDSTSFTVVSGLCREDVVRFVVDVANKVGTHVLDVEVDPNGSLNDRRSDNRVRTTFTVFAKSLLIVEPDPYGVVNTSDVRARVIDILSTPQNTMKIEMVISESQDTTSPLLRSLPEEIIRSGSIVDWETTRTGLGLVYEADVWLGVWATDTATQVRTAIAWTPVKVFDRDAPSPSWHEVGARHATILSDSLEYDTVSRTVRLITYDRDVFVRSSGVMTSDPDKDPILEVRIGSATVIKSAFRTGLNIVVIGQRDTVPLRIRRYDTSKDPLPIGTGHNGFARECLAFLRDSIAETERIVIAACNESFSRFVTDGLLDSLRIELKRLGSKLCDSISISSSFAFLGSRTTAPGAAFESWKGAPEYMVTVETPLAFHYPSGRVTSPLIGPARTWTSVSFGSSGDVKSKLWGYRSDGSTLLLDTTGRWTPGQDQQDVVALSYEWEIIGTEQYPDAFVGDIQADYEPLPQWIVEADGLTLETDTVLRGIPARGTVRVRNARTEFRAPAMQFTVTSFDSATMSTIGQQTFELSEIDADEWSEQPFAVLTEASSAKTLLVAKLENDPEEPELFRVLDECRTMLSIASDSTPPVIEPFIDDRLMPVGGWVYQKPMIEVRLRDNSPLYIYDSERMIVFVNGVRIRQTTSEDYEFLNTPAAQAEWPGTDVRAAMRFRFPLELGENLLIVRASDAWNNTDTLEIPLLTSNETRLDAVTVVPNPSTGPVSFVVSLVSANATSEANMDIFDVQGRHIRSLPTQISVGEGRVNWDGRGDAGEVLAAGVYAWKLSVKDANGGVASTTNGTLILVR
ncbi:MAG TPA: C25 family cysteine peptidase [Candidatus Didemnitutus sp.]|nr:C25 family cysteine peptidase [Candidatus Didemnitutus sp.]